MGYGSRAIDLLGKYYEGELFSGTGGASGGNDAQESSEESSEESSSGEEEEDEEEDEDESTALPDDFDPQNTVRAGEHGDMA